MASLLGRLYQVTLAKLYLGLLGLNLLRDGLRDMLDPRLRGQFKAGVD